MLTLFYIEGENERNSDRTQQAPKKQKKICDVHHNHINSLSLSFALFIYLPTTFSISSLFSSL